MIYWSAHCGCWRERYMFSERNAVLLTLTILVCLSSLVEVSGDLTGGSSIETGKFTDKAAMTALGKLSQGRGQQAWWKLTNTDWHASALDRYFALGPLSASDMKKVAEIGAQGASSVWKQIEPSGSHDLLQTLQNLSSITYEMTRSFVGVGRVEASLRTILFGCGAYENDCETGYMTPLIIAHAAASGSATSPPSSEVIDDKTMSYAYVWLPFSSTVLVNAVPAFLRGMNFSSTSFHKDQELSISMNVNSQLPRCPNTSYLAFRSQLDASYGLLPGLDCLSLKSKDGGEHVTLLAARPASRTSLDQDFPPEFTLDDLLSVTLNHSLDHFKVEPRPLEECSKEAMLLSRQDDLTEAIVQLCLGTVCAKVVINSDGNGFDFQCNISSTQSAHLLPLYQLKFLQLVVAGSSKSCNVSDIHGGFVTCNITMMAKQAAAAGAASDGNVLQCNRSGIFRYEIDPKDIDLIIVSPESKWASSKGFNRTEFQNAPAHISSLKPCSKPLPSLVLSSSSDSSFLNFMLLEAKGTLETFVKAHGVALAMNRGPQTEYMSILALLVSTGVSVLVGVAGPMGLMRFFLDQAQRRWPDRLKERKAGGWCWMMGMDCCQMSISFVCAVLNAVVSVLIFLPVLYVASSEVGRQKPFHTWNLGSSDLTLDAGVNIRIVALLTATSTYGSHAVGLRMCLRGGLQRRVEWALPRKHNATLFLALERRRSKFLFPLTLGGSLECTWRQVCLHGA